MAKEKSESLRVEETEFLCVIDHQTQTNVWFLGAVLGIKQVQCTKLPDKGIMRYECFTHNINNPLVVDLPMSASLDEKVAALRLALRMYPNGYDHQGEEGCHTSA